MKTTLNHLNYYALTAGANGSVRGAQEWPREILEKFDDKWLEGAFGFPPDSKDENEFLRLCNLEGLAVHKTVVGSGRTQGNGGHFLVAVSDGIGGFSADGCFEKAEQCDNPPPDYIAGMRGCALSKRQVGKWRALKAPGAKKSDIYLTTLVEGPRLAPNEHFIISRRLRHIIGAANLTGIRLSPILETGDRWNKDEAAYDSRVESQDVTARWFQLTVTGRTRPLRLASNLKPHPRIVNQECTVCGRDFGEVDESITWRTYDADFFSTDDLQLCNQVVEPTGHIATLASSIRLPLVASASFVETMRSNQVKGFLRTTPYPAVDFWPLAVPSP